MWYIKRKMKGEQVSGFLYHFTGMPKDQSDEVLLRVLTDGNSNVKIESSSPFDTTDRDHDINLEYDLKVSNAVSNFDNTYYLELDPVRYISNFKIQEDR
jgi:hypothetical protein